MDDTTTPVSHFTDQEARMILSHTIAGEYFVVHVDLAFEAGGLHEGILLEYLMRWSGKSDDGWCYRTADQIKQDTMLTVKMQRTARERLQERNLLHIERRGVPAQNFYRPNFAEIAGVLYAGANLDTVRRRYAQTAHQDVPKQQIKIRPNGTSIYRDTEEEQKKNNSIDPPNQKPVRQAPTYTADFEAFWSQTHRRGTKLQAADEWDRLSADDHAKIMAALPAWKSSEDWNREPKFILHIERWLKYRHFDDEPVSAKSAAVRKDGRAARMYPPLSDYGKEMAQIAAQEADERAAISAAEEGDDEPW